MYAEIVLLAWDVASQPELERSLAARLEIKVFMVSLCAANHNNEHVENKEYRSVSMILRHLPGEFSEAIRHSGCLGSGGLIQTLSSSRGDCGGLRTKRSGVVRKA